MAVTIYHNPRCSKSRATLELLKQHGVEPLIRLYLQEPPSMADLNEICALLALPPTGFIRFGESVARELNITRKDQRSQAEWCELIQHHPMRCPEIWCRGPAGAVRIVAWSIV
jgi:arsenate reductase